MSILFFVLIKIAPCFFKVLKALALTLIVCGLPSTTTRTFCKFTFHLRRVARIECQRLFPDKGPRPDTSHLFDILIVLLFNNMVD